MSALKNNYQDTFDDSIIIPNLGNQLMLFGEELMPHPQQSGNVFFEAHSVDLDRYERIIVCMSGGKDSIACLLHLIDLGVDLTKVELWHHEVDGREGSTLMDWSFMTEYNKALAKHFDIPIYFSWLRGGFEGEMLKENGFGQPHHVETPDGLIILERDTARSKPQTRLKFPQVGADLRTRWCSSALKIDVGRRALNNQDRFLGIKTLFITGERREESSNRSKYNQLEPHLCDTRKGRTNRFVDAWRPVLHWSEEQVWEIIERHRIVAPVPYRLGWSRSSCMNCIFNDASIWATILNYFPENIEVIAAYEAKFGVTINRNKIPIFDVAKSASFIEIDDEDALLQAMREEYTLPIITPVGHHWHLPKGAFSKSGCGAI